MQQIKRKTQWLGSKTLILRVGKGKKGKETSGQRERVKTVGRGTIQNNDAKDEQKKEKEEKKKLKEKKEKERSKRMVAGNVWMLERGVRGE